MARLALPERPGLLRVSLPSEGVACVQMEDAAGNNALSHDMVGALGESFAALGAENSLRAIVLTGLPEVFSSGAAREVIDDLASGRRDSGEVLLPRVLLEIILGNGAWLAVFVGNGRLCDRRRLWSRDRGRHRADRAGKPLLPEFS